MRTRIRRVLAIPVALVLGLGFTVALAVPASADGAFTVAVDKNVTIYSTSTLTWSGTHDPADPISFAIRDAANPDGTAIGASCTDGAAGGDPVAYACSSDLSAVPGGVTPGDWELVGSMITGDGSGLENASDAFTVAESATVSVTDSPVRQGGTLQFGGTKLSAASIEQFGLIQGENEISLNPDCVGSDDASTAWTCSVALDPGIATGEWTLQLTVFTNGHASAVRTEFEVTPDAEAPLVSYTPAPGSITVIATPTTGHALDQVGVALYSWSPGDGFGIQADCGDAGGDEGGPSIPVDLVQSQDGVSLTCVFSGLPPGIWNPYSTQGTEGRADDYFTVPVAPVIQSVTDLGDGAAAISGTGVDGDVVQAGEGGLALCTATVTAGTWSCDAHPGVGPHTLSAVQSDQGAGRNDAIREGDPGIVYLTGGTSAAGASVAVTLAAPATPAVPGTKLTTPVWTFSIDGIDTSNLHPGDTFTASGSGLPGGATVAFVLHSTPVTLGQTTVARDGTFTFQGAIPLDTESGAHQIIATLSGSGLVSTTNAKDVKVATAVAPASATDTLPKTESGSGDASADATGGTHESRDQLQPEVEPNVLTDGLDSIGDVVQHPGKIPAAVAIGLVLLVLGVLPAHLLDATVAEQYERLGRRFPRLAKRPAWLERFQGWLRRAPALGGLLVTSVTAVLFCFADPRFGFNLESVRLLIALAVALFVVTYLVDAVTALIVRRAWDVAVTVSVRPLGLVLSLIGVIASRALHFSPGFLIGLVLGLSIAGTAAGRYAWRAIAIRTGLILGLAVAAWAGFSAFSHDGAEHDFTTALLLELLVAIATEGIVALMVELLPFHLLEGERVFHRSKVLWGALYLVTVVIFVVAVVPWEGNWAELGSGLWAWLGVLVAFAVIATGIYVYFRRRSHHEHEVEEDVAEQEQVPIGED